VVKVVLVGDEPSRTNINSNIAFVGARCFNTVIEWIKILQPDYYICLNSNTESQLSDIESLVKAGFKIIALGNEAEKELKRIEIDYYKLPHPSGLNRQNNNKQLVEEKLKGAYQYVRR
jgi:uracil-DNA glycosylase